MTHLINNQNELFYNRIKRKCKDNAITMSELCRRSNVSRASLANWKNKNPNTINILYKLEAELEKLEPENDFLCIASEKCSKQCVSCQLNSK